ncbi:nucleoside monophosphate kinase [Blastopirellula sp. JC732]|uniref:Adenylate kinase n=1 Tax=Blastopirellula sediminis TaxID=2894196 RepID=A0A9X1MNG1_9BACT|nr:nucleoside monophosphate kinase [Blastopirellula sediminis]MCC9607200.1 nucleoside monophosphate kinase [Blastopirellula sediminis]MCC9629507.1 nucleoside monophosphate kinase [Blastopirellula sediminis]
MRKYIIMGVQGCGKGTQAKLLCKAYDLAHISVGDIFRWNIANHTKLAARVQRLISHGELVSDDIVADVVKSRLAEHDWNFGYILDGFPRNAVQAEFFLESYDIDAVIHIVVPDDVVRERVLSRRLCSGCGLDYNLIHHRPRNMDICDVCGAPLTQRPDDTPGAVADRLKTYHEKTAPILDLFRRKELVLEVDGMQPADAVHQEIQMQLGLKSSWR